MKFCKSRTQKAVDAVLRSRARVKQWLGRGYRPGKGARVTILYITAHVSGAVYYAHLGSWGWLWDRDPSKAFSFTEHDELMADVEKTLTAAFASRDGYIRGFVHVAGSWCRKCEAFTRSIDSGETCAVCRLIR